MLCNRLEEAKTGFPSNRLKRFSMSDSIEDSDTGRAEGRIKRADIQGQYESEPSLIKSFQSHAVSCDDASGVKLAVPRNFATTSWRKHGGHAN